MWGGGVILLVAAVLWMLYLLPSWHGRHRYDSAERNAVRLNQALRVLAETSETPDEVRLELSARTALAQQRLARRTLAEKERVGLAQARLELEAARAEARAMRARPDVRMARARRRVRLGALGATILSLAVTSAGVWTLSAVGTATLLWVGVAGTLVGLGTLQRMSQVARRAAARTYASPVAARAASELPDSELQDVELPAPVRQTWEPRPLPRPLSSSAGSTAAAIRDAADARASLRRAAVEEAKREQAERAAPPSIDTARVVRPEPAASAFARMGYVDDAEIEAHVRKLLQGRSAS